MKNIKGAKYLIGLILIMIGFLFNGELFFLYIDNFQNSYYRSSLSFPQSVQEAENTKIIGDFLNAGEKNGVDFYFVDSRIISEYEKEVSVYGTPGALTELQKSVAGEGEYSSLLMGNVSVTYREVTDITDMTKFENCYLIGDESKLPQMQKFKAMLIDKYGGGFPHLYGSDRELYINLAAVWTIIFGILLLISVYEVTCLRKETALRFVLGEKISGLFIKSAVADTCVYLFILFLVPAVLQNVSYVSFRSEFTAGAALIFLMANILILSWMLHVNIKKSLAGILEKKEISAVSYLLKMVTGILTIIVLSGNMMIAAQGYNMYRQEDFFRENRDFFSYELSYNPETDMSKLPFDAEDMQRSFYAEFFRDSLQFADMSSQMGYDYPMLLINRPAFIQLGETYPEMKDLRMHLKEDGCYILFPSGLDQNAEAMGNARQLGEQCFAKYVKRTGKTSDGAAMQTVDVQSIPYEEKIEATAVDDKISFQSTMLDNPIILLDMTVPDIDEPMRSDYWNYGTIYKIEEEKYIDFLERFALTDEIAIKSNVLELYRHNWKIVQRSLRIAMVLSVFLLILEVFLISFILRLQYRLNAAEMALKKITGYSLIARNQQLIAAAAGSCVLSIIGAFIVNVFSGFSAGGYILASGALVTAFEVILLIRKAVLLEKERIPQILKGEDV